MRRLSIAVGLLAVVALLGQAAAQDAQKASGATGKIVKLDRDHDTIALAERDGSTAYYSVDEEAVPGWYINHRVGEVVALTLAQQGEKGTRVVAIRHISDGDSN